MGKDRRIYRRKRNTVEDKIKRFRDLIPAEDSNQEKKPRKTNPRDLQRNDQDVDTFDEELNHPREFPKEY